MVSETVLLLGRVSCDRITHSYKAQNLNLNYLVNLSRSRRDHHEFAFRNIITSRLFALLSRDFEQMFGQIVSIRMKTLSNTNMAASRLIKAHFRLTCVVQKRRCLSSLIRRPSLYSLKQNHSFVSNKYVSQALNANNIKRHKRQK